MAAPTWEEGAKWEDTGRTDASLTKWSQHGANSSDEASQVGQPTGIMDHFHRLLHDINKEYARLTDENSTLHREVSRLKMSSAAASECGLSEADVDEGAVKGASEPAPQRPPLLFARSGMTKYPCVHDFPEEKKAIDDESQARKRAFRGRQQRSSNSGLSGLSGAEEEEEVEAGNGENNRQSLPSKEQTNSVRFSNVFSPDWRNVEDRLNNGTYVVGDHHVPSALAKQLREQYERVTNMRGLMSARDCWVLVSQFEHKVYGHNKHPLRRVAKTVKYINTTYGGGNNNKQHNNNETSGNSFRSDYGTASNGILSDNSNNASTDLDFETFLLFMADEGRFSGDDEVGDLEYLKKAFRAEATENMAEVARKAIAERTKEDDDPMPEGWLFIVLERMPPIVIFANAVVLGLQADIERGSNFWEILELCFLGFYIVEAYLKLRLLGFLRFFRGGDWRWNWFDLLCIILSLIDVSSKYLWEGAVEADQVTFLKILRLARLARIIKSFRYKFFDDLKVMALGVLSGARVLGWAVLLFFVCVFVIGVVTRELFPREPPFSTLPAAMFTTFRCFTDGCSNYDGTPLHEKMRDEYGGLFMVGYILVFLVVTFGIFNLIIAVFIDSVGTTTIKRKQQELGKREDEMKLSIEELLVNLVRHANSGRRASYSNRSKSTVEKADFFTRQQKSAEAMAQVRAERVQISRELFNTWLTDKDVLALLEDVEIDTATKSEIFDVCDVDKSGSLTCDELVSGLMRLRGPISKCDVIAIRLKVRYLTKMLEDIHHVLGA